MKIRFNNLLKSKKLKYLWAIKNRNKITKKIKSQKQGYLREEFSMVIRRKETSSKNIYDDNPIMVFEIDDAVVEVDNKDYTIPLFRILSEKRNKLTIYSNPFYKNSNTLLIHLMIERNLLKVIFYLQDINSYTFKI